MGLKDRLKRLEGSEAGSRCEECGISPDDPVTFSIGEGLKGGEKLPPPEYCAACGQMTSVSFTLDLGSSAINPRPEEDQ
jgi:hypothetical protein